MKCLGARRRSGQCDIRRKLLGRGPRLVVITSSQMSQKPLGERFGMLPMHEMPTSDFLDEVLVLEHPGGTPVVRGLGNWIIEARKHDHWHGDPHFQRCGGYRGRAFGNSRTPRLNSPGLRS